MNSFFVEGQYDLSKPDPGEQEISVDSIIIHRDFLSEEDDRSNDIALIKLSKDVQYGKTVGPVCLPEKTTRVRPGQMCYITGKDFNFLLFRALFSTISSNFNQHVHNALFTTDCFELFTLVSTSFSFQ